MKDIRIRIFHLKFLIILLVKFSVFLNRHVFVMNTDIYAYMLIYHQMSSLFATLDQIQKISKIVFIFLLIYLFIY